MAPVGLLSLLFLQVNLAESLDKTLFTLYTAPRVSWLDAVNFCRDRGQELVRVTSVQEHSFLRNFGQAGQVWFNKTNGDTWSSLHDPGLSTNGYNYSYRWQLLGTNDTLPLAIDAWQNWYGIEPSNTSLNFCVKLVWDGDLGFWWRTEHCETKLEKVICRINEGLCNDYSPFPNKTTSQSSAVIPLSTNVTKVGCQQTCTEVKDSSNGVTCYAAEWINGRLCLLHMAEGPFLWDSLKFAPPRIMFVSKCLILGLICDYVTVYGSTIQTSAEARLEYRNVSDEGLCKEACTGQKIGPDGVGCFAAEWIHNQWCVLHMAKNPFITADIITAQNILFVRLCLEAALNENFTAETTSVQPASTFQYDAAALNENFAAVTTSVQPASTFQYDAESMLATLGEVESSMTTSLQITQDSATLGKDFVDQTTTADLTLKLTSVPYSPISTPLTTINITQDDRTFAVPISTSTISPTFLTIININEKTTSTSTSVNESMMATLTTSLQITQDSATQSENFVDQTTTTDLILKLPSIPYSPISATLTTINISEDVSTFAIPIPTSTISPTFLTIININDKITTISTSVKGHHATSQNLCACSCIRNMLPPSTVEEQQEVLTELKKTLTIEKKNTTNYQRKLSSAQDQRTSAKTIGWLGMVVLLLVFSVIVTLDASGVFCARHHRVMSDVHQLCSRAEKL